MINLDYVLKEVLNRVALNESIIREEDKKLTFPSGLRWRYWKIRKGKKEYRYCYSVGRNGNGKFVSWIYFPVKSGWAVRKVVEHCKKGDAINRARRLRDKGR